MKAKDLKTTHTEEDMLNYWASKVEHMTQHTPEKSNHGEYSSHAIELKEAQKILFELTQS